MVRRLARAVFVAVVLAVVLPVMMIAAFHLQDPDLYPFPQFPAFCMCP